MFVDSDEIKTDIFFFSWPITVVLSSGSVGGGGGDSGGSFRACCNNPTPSKY